MNIQREKRQILNYDKVYDKLFVGSKPDDINVNQLDKIIKYLNLTEIHLLNECRNNNIISKLVSMLISKQSSRQGSLDEKFQINNLNEEFKNLNICISRNIKHLRPHCSSNRILSNSDLKKQNIKKSECLKSFDAIIHRNKELLGWCFMKCCYGSGGHQDNVFIEINNFLQWVKTYGNSEMLYLIVVDTDLKKQLDNSKELRNDLKLLNCVVGFSDEVINFVKQKLVESSNFDETLKVKHNAKNETSNIETNSKIEIKTKKDNKKSKLGQFYTTNADYILSDMCLDMKVPLIEPFAGTGDLIKHAQKFNNQHIESYDLDVKCENCIQRDTLLNPPDYNGKFVITNPPYLARNKSSNKTIFDKYEQNDLYKCFVLELTNQNPVGGIIIIPVNFWSSIRKEDVILRKKFLTKFNVKLVNIFEEQVFDDTSCSVCSIWFETIDKPSNNINFIIYPNKELLQINISKENNYIIGYEIYKLQNLKSDINIEKNTKKSSQCDVRSIVVKCIDDNIKNQIRAFVDKSDLYVDNTEKNSNRAYIRLSIYHKLSDDQIENLVNNFNEFINTARKKYHSMFLSNYRESNTIARKRISFKLVIGIMKYLIKSI